MKERYIIMNTKKDEIIKYIRERYIYFLAYLYLFSSVAIFLLGNVKFIISIPIVCALFIALVKAINNAPIMKVKLFANKKKFFIIFIVIIFWVFFGGIGGFIWQNPWDHKFRNAVFMDLVNKSWPVVQNGKALCYYFGFYLPSAIIGKILGLQVGYLFQCIWAILGISIAFGMLCEYLNNVKIKNIFIFIFYSGLDIFLYLIFQKLSLGQLASRIYQGTHIELATWYFNSSSNTTLIFWLYNQIIPFWVGMMLLLQQKNSKSVVWIYSLMLLYSPFPLVALAPIIVYLIFRNNQENKIEEKNIIKNIFTKIKYACTFENIISIFIILLVGLFFKSNIAAGKISLLKISKDTIWKYLCYIFFEYLIYLIFIYKENRKDPILNILIVTTFLLPFIKLGNGYDFAWRTCIPLAFYIMVLIMKKLENSNTNKIIKICIVIILCLGAITPMSEMIRTSRNEIKAIRGKTPTRSEKLQSVFIKQENECYDNFVANTESIFYRYFSK